MRILASLVAIAVAAAVASAETPPDDAKCRSYVEEGLALRDPVKARAVFHTARVRCANPVTLVMIARTYQDAGDLPRTLAYLEAFLAIAEPGHQARPVVEQAVVDLRALVAADQRVSISDELAAATAAATAGDSTQARLNTSVEGDDAAVATPQHITTTVGVSAPPRLRTFFIGANVGYAPMARVDVTHEGMTGRTNFSGAFAGVLRASYRLRPSFSLGMVSQLFFNLRPENEDAATEVALFAQATFHYRVRPRWDLDLFGAPGYSVLLVPGNGGNPNGLALRWGGGLIHHVSERLSLAAELAHQVGFQRERDADVDTSFVSVLFGVRIQP